MEKIKEKVEGLFNETFYGHPSAIDYFNIKQLQRAVILIAEELDNIDNNGTQQ